jgi:hypothetical protein
MFETKLVGLKDESTFYPCILFKFSAKREDIRFYSEKMREAEESVISGTEEAKIVSGMNDFWADMVADYLLHTQGFRARRAKANYVFIWKIGIGRDQKLTYDMSDWRDEDFKHDRALFSAHYWLKTESNWKKVSTGDIIQFDYERANKQWLEFKRPAMDSFFDKKNIKLIKNGLLDDMRISFLNRFNSMREEGLL